MDWFNIEIQKLLIAAVLGAVIGLEREWRAKKAGFRTLMLVSVGSCLFTILSTQLGAIGTESDRIASNIVTGVSFLGVGLIFREEQVVRGLTTAATVWASAAVGMAIGAGNYRMAIAATALIWVILVVFYKIQLAFNSWLRTRTYAVRYHFNEALRNKYEQLFRESGGRVLNAQLQKQEGIATARWTVRAKDAVHDRLVDTLMRDEQVMGLDY